MGLIDKIKTWYNSRKAEPDVEETHTYNIVCNNPGMDEMYNYIIEQNKKNWRDG